MSAGRSGLATCFFAPRCFLKSTISSFALLPAGLCPAGAQWRPPGPPWLREFRELAPVPNGLIRSNKVRGGPAKYKVLNKVQNEEGHRGTRWPSSYNPFKIYGAERGT